MKYTPGKWQARFNRVESKRLDGSREIVCDCAETIFSEANAKLIAAAPEMFSALQGAIHHDNALTPKYKLPASLRSQIEAAISLATT